MAVSKADLEAMDRDELVDVVLELAERVDDLEDRVKENREFAARDRADIRASMNELGEELRTEIRQEGDRQARERSQVTRRVANVEDELGIEDQDVVALANGDLDDLYESDLARLLEAGPTAVTKRPSPVYERAQTLARNWINWGAYADYSNGIAERTLATRRDDLRTRLSDARNEELSWKQVYRAMVKVADLGPPNITMTERDQGKMLVQRIENIGGDR